MQFDFKNSDGDLLSGRLERPKGEPVGTALFAHCFTCSKDVIAASTIAKKLTQLGIGVLRFDFTGLGSSQGDFANTNFSSNVQDLLSACSALTEKSMAPTLLVGHSLGGAAVLEAAKSLPKVRAVVTLGAPSSVEHVSHLFEDDLDTILSQGLAKVQLAGRPFTIKRQFIEDMKQANVLEGVEGLGKALLVMHAPSDNTVSIDHAAQIFMKAKHPKSFVSLDSADHLLMNRKDADYAAQIIGAWVSRYL